MTTEEIMALADVYAYATINVNDPEARRGKARAKLEEALAQARSDALEEAAQIAEDIETYGDAVEEKFKCVNAIRALKEKSNV